MYFDARAAKLLQPGKHIVVDACPGLRLVASTAGKSWIYRYKHDGKMRQIKIGVWPSMPISAASAKWHTLKTERELGADPAAERKAAIAARSVRVYTVKNLVEDYITGHLNISRAAAGANAVAARLRNNIGPIAKMAASDVTRGDAFDLITAVVDTPVAAKSLKNELGAAWALALDSGKLSPETPNWWRQVLVGKLKSKGQMREGKPKGTAKRVLSKAEIKTLLTQDMALFSQQVQDFLTLQLWTCTRGAEIVQMRPEYISTEPDGVWWTMPKSLLKTARHENAVDLRVPLVGRALEIVQRLCQQHDGWLFPSTSRKGVVGPQKQTYMQTKVHYYQPYSKSRADHVRKRLSVTHWSPHDLRRTGRTMLAALKCPNEIGELILGHVRPGVEGDYDLYR
jgi:integrase